MTTATLPPVTLEIAGSALAPEDARGLVSIRVVQRLSMPSLCEMHFVDPRGVVGTGPEVLVGLSIRLSVDSGAEPLFAGEVTAVEHVHTATAGHEVIVRGYDALHRLRRRQPLRTFENHTPAALARALCADLGIGVDATIEGPVVPRILQHGETDLELLATVAARCGMHFQVRGEQLWLGDLRGAGDAVELVLGESLLEARCELNGDPACASVTAVGWDPLTSSLHEGTAAELLAANGPAARIPGDFLAPEGTRRVHLAVQGRELAVAMAQGELDVRSAAAVAVVAAAKDRPEVRPGGRVLLRGVAQAFAGEYTVAAATHTFDQTRGSVVEFDTRPPRGRPRTPSASMVPGVVRSVQDPEGLGRVRVAFPACGDLETEWLAVLQPGAAATKGLVALPDVGDRVLVLCPEDDPAQGVVLGCLFGDRAPADTGVVGDRVRRFHFGTPDGQRLTLDDERRMLRVENNSGSSLEMTPDHVRLCAGADLTIEAAGKAIVIAGKSIDFRRA